MGRGGRGEEERGTGRIGSLTNRRIYMLPTSHCGVWRQWDGERYEEMDRQPIGGRQIDEAEVSMPFRDAKEEEEEEVESEGAK